MARLALNPNAWLKPAGEAGGKVDDGYVVVVPDATRRVLSRREIREAAPEFDAVRRLYENLAQARKTIAAGDLPQLAELGLVVDPATITPRPRFHLALSAEGDVSQRTVRVTAAGEFRFDDTNEEKQIAHGALARGERFWHSPVKGRRGLPWWPEPRIASVVRELAASGGALVAEPDARALSAAGIIEPLDDDAHGTAENWTTASLLEHHYAYGARLFPAAVIPALAEFYRNMCLGGFCFYGDSARRYFSHNDRIGLLFQDYALDAVQRIVPRPIKPSYTYFSGYRNESVLVNHHDREQCEYTLNLILDYRPEDVGAASWPLMFEAADGKVGVVSLEAGESALFQGRLLEHSRPTLRPEHECDILLMHYVNDDFEGTLD